MTMLSVDAHYDEETLIRVAEAAVEIEDTHLDECAECRGAVDEYRDMLSCVADDVVWDQRPIDDTPNPQTIATLRAFVEDMHREDAEAEPLVAELLAGSREEWMPRLLADEKYRTAGVVRKLIAATDVVTQSSAADYGEIASLLVTITDALPLSNDADVVLKLRGAAWRELAYARYLAGAIDGAGEAERIARSCFSETKSAGFDLARLDILLAMIESRCEKTHVALARVENSLWTFTAFGSEKRVLDAMWLQSNVLSERKAFAAALAVSREIRLRFDDVLDDHARASILANEGYYLRETGDHIAALERLREAAFFFETVGAKTNAARVAFNVAVLLYSTGHLHGAALALEKVIGELRSVGLTGVATLALLYLAEVRLAQERYDEIEPLCRAACEQVTASAVAYRERALIALGLLREVAAHRRASLPLIQHVRTYVARLPSEPNLLFAPVPGSPDDRIFG
jgi:tetratricopeptide (TPR) repeat protein